MVVALTTTTLTIIVTTTITITTRESSATQGKFLWVVSLLTLMKVGVVVVAVIVDAVVFAVAAVVRMSIK